jgi:hypothetical protein
VSISIRVPHISGIYLPYICCQYFS